MKICQPCKREALDEAMTCAACGEGSWELREIAADLDKLAEAAELAPEAPAPEPKRRRGRK